MSSRLLLHVAVKQQIQLPAFTPTCFVCPCLHRACARRWRRRCLMTLHTSHSRFTFCARILPAGRQLSVSLFAVLFHCADSQKKSSLMVSCACFITSRLLPCHPSRAFFAVLCSRPRLTRSGRLCAASLRISNLLFWKPERCHDGGHLTCTAICPIDLVETALNTELPLRWHFVYAQMPKALCFLGHWKIGKLWKMCCSTKARMAVTKPPDRKERKKRTQSFFCVSSNFCFVTSTFPVCLMKLAFACMML